MKWCVLVNKGLSFERRETYGKKSEGGMGEGTRENSLWLV